MSEGRHCLLTWQLVCSHLGEKHTLCSHQQKMNCGLGFVSGIWVGVSWIFHNLFILMANLDGSYLDRPLVFVAAFVLEIVYSLVLCQQYYLDACIITNADSEHKCMVWNVPLLWQCILSWWGNGGDSLEKKVWNCLQKTPYSFVPDAGM